MKCTQYRPQYVCRINTQFDSYFMFVSMRIRKIHKIILKNNHERVNYEKELIFIYLSLTYLRVSFVFQQERYCISSKTIGTYIVFGEINSNK